MRFDGDAVSLRHSRGAEALIGGVIVLVLVIVGIAAQQTIFYNFVYQTGGEPRGLFERTDGSYYKLWSFTVPLWMLTTLIAGVGIWWAVRLIRLGSAWYVVAGWLVYVMVMWSFVVLRAAWSKYSKPARASSRPSRGVHT